MFREYEAFLEAKLRQTASPGPLPISELYWLQRTSKGLGMVAERARGKSGETASSLGTLQRAGGIDGFSIFRDQSSSRKGSANQEGQEC